MDEELFPRLRTPQVVWDYVWSGYAVTIDARRRVMLGPRPEPSLPAGRRRARAADDPPSAWPFRRAGASGSSASCSTCWTPGVERGLVQLRASGRVVETTEPRANQPATSSCRSCSAADDPCPVTPRRVQLGR